MARLTRHRTMNNFTPRAQQVLALARKEADRFNHNYVGTEHLLLGLIKLGQGVAVNVLQKMGLDLETVRMEVEKQVGSGPETKIVGNVPYTPRVKKVLALAGKEAKALNHSYVGTEHILLGLLREGEGVAARVLKSLELDIERTRNEILKELDPNFTPSESEQEGGEPAKKDIKTPALRAFGRDLTELAKKGELDPVIGRRNEIERVIQVLCRRTKNEYRKYIEKDAALERRFQTIKVDAPTVDEAIQILKGLRPKYEAHHKAKLTDEALETAVRFSDRYITGRFLPDKAIDVMDEAGARARINAMTRPPDVKDIEKEIEEIRLEKEGAIKAQDFEKAAALRDKEKQTKEKLDAILNKWREEREEKEVVVTADDMMHIISKVTGVPLQRMEQEETQKLLMMEAEMKQRVIGQDEAVTAISKALRRSRADLKDPKRPIGSFVFLGPTGVGKTYLARTLAEFMFGDADALIQIDMSEYMEKFTASRLIGSPPGYVGYEEGGQLSEAVRRRPYSVVLFDAIEKAHPDVFNVLLQILDDGRLTDSKGRTADFRNTVLIMTSNLASREIQAAEGNENQVRDAVMQALRLNFKPEFLNRIDDIVVFHQLSRKQIRQIVDVQLERLREMLHERNITLVLDESARELLAREGYDPNYGARPLKRAIQTLIQNPLAVKLLRGEILSGETVKVLADGDKMRFNTELAAAVA